MSEGSYYACEAFQNFMSQSDSCAATERHYVCTDELGQMQLPSAPCTDYGWKFTCCEAAEQMWGPAVVSSIDHASQTLIFDFTFFSLDHKWSNHLRVKTLFRTAGCKNKSVDQSLQNAASSSVRLSRSTCLKLRAVRRPRVTTFAKTRRARSHYHPHLATRLALILGAAQRSSTCGPQAR